MFIIMHINKCFSSMWRWACSYVYFPKGAPFVSGLVLSFKFLDNAYTALLTTYLPETSTTHQGTGNFRKGTAIVVALAVLRIFAAIIFEHIAVNCIGNFKLIIYSFPALFMGLLLSLWWLSRYIFLSLLLSRHVVNGILYPSSALIMVGSAGLDVAVDSFLCDQFVPTMGNTPRAAEIETIEDQFLLKKKRDEYMNTLETRANVWKYTASILAGLAAWAFGPQTKIPDTKEKTVIVSLIFAGVSYLVFGCGKCCFRHAAPEGQTVASVVKQAKPLVKLLPLWMTFISCGLVLTTVPTLFYTQSARLDSDGTILESIHINVDEISLTTFSTLFSFTSGIASFVSDFLINKFWSSKETIQHRARFVRIGIGMLFASGCCIAAWRVEVSRLSRLEDDEDPMTILWVAPQFCLLGITDGLLQNGLRDFFYDRVPVSIRYLNAPFTSIIVLGIGVLVGLFSILVARPWIRQDMDESRVDNYFLVVAILNIFNLFVFIILFYKYDWNVVELHDVPVEEVSSPLELEIDQCDDVLVEEVASPTDLVIESSSPGA